ncbi:MAG: transcriptional regulator [Bacteroidetes bacterium GWF2_38_335]|nr:MAG: transcriptional regulator [Bacteroidetes bacterium GWF2_38_335]OFY77096.1 MAG: transcriptional regulator [Bacteroidetes bacterium RIFOXYA12_FULL_38_20]HBS84986.1 transcriptional regulator [Bacteroidales bacterium]
MLDTLVTSKTRIKLLLKFFLNAQSSAYLRSLEAEFGESTNAIRVELNRFEKAGLLESFSERNKKMFKANTNHPVFKEIQSMLLKFIGIDQILDKIINRLGDINKVFITGDFAMGKDSGQIDLVIVSEKTDTEYLNHLIGKTEPLIKRKILYQILDQVQFVNKFPAKNQKNLLLIFSK